ncbi:MAG: MFS transporter [Bdellovibrionaceae bacterium]|nr:MFS transporter [Pseudobdellovibrionaceae bacterium]
MASAHLENWQLRFWVIVSGQALSQIGSAVSQFILLWWIASTSGEVGALATGGIFALLPQALLGPLGGVLADRYSRRLIMILSDTITACCMLVLISLFAQDRVELWHVYTLLAVRSSMQAFQGPASQASAVMLVPESFLTRAAGLNQIVLSLMTIAAAPIGAFAMSLLPFQGALMIDVVTATLGIIPLLIFKIPQPERTSATTSAWREFKDGIDLVWHSPPLRQLYALNGTLIMILMPTFTLVPLLVTRHFKGDISFVATMEGLAGVAMLLGGVATTILVPKRKVITLLLGLAICSFAVGLTAVATRETFIVAVFFWCLSGFAYTYGNTPVVALLQQKIPPQLQGRAFSLLTTVAALAAPAGLTLFGPLGDIIGIRELYILAGTVGGLICVASLWSRGLRQLESAEKLEVNG